MVAFLVNGNGLHFFLGQRVSGVTMNKRFFLSLIALAAFVGFGCDEDSGSSNDTNCTNFAKQCVGNQLNQCVNGEWKTVSTCTSGCNAELLQCNEAVAKCTSGDDCSSTPATPECNMLTGKCQAASSIGDQDFTPTPIPEGQSTTLNDPCDDTYVSSCINGGEDMLLCWNNVITQWSCDSCIAAGYNPDKPNEAKCVRNAAQRPADVPETCEYKVSKAICASDGRGWVCGDSNTYYTSANLNCTADKPCVLCDNGYVGCGVTCNSAAERPADVPETCEYKVSSSLCASDGNAWICGNENTYYTGAKFKCTAEKPCKICKNGYAGCGITCNEDKAECTSSSTEACNGACSADKTEGYYWSNDKVVVLTCANADCNIASNGYVNCGVADSDCTAESTSICKGACNADKTEGYYWSNNAIKKLTCANADCSVSDTGYVSCASNK